MPDVRNYVAVIHLKTEKSYLHIDVFCAQVGQVGLGRFPPIPQSAHYPMSLTALHRNEEDRETWRCIPSVALAAHVGHPSSYDRKYGRQVRVIQKETRCWNSRAFSKSRYRLPVHSSRFLRPVPRQYIWAIRKHFLKSSIPCDDGGLSCIGKQEVRGKDSQ